MAAVELNRGASHAGVGSQWCSVIEAQTRRVLGDGSGEQWAVSDITKSSSVVVSVEALIKSPPEG